MSETIDRLKPELARLTKDERADLASFLLSSLDEGETDVVVSRELLERRSAELRSGDAVGVPGEEVLERLRKRFP